jgi:holin-like protein
MLDFIIILLGCQLAGEALSKAFDLPLPGPVIGMGLLFIGLVIKGGVPEGLQRTAQGLLDHLSLLFVPAGVGVLVHLSVISKEWLPISVSLVLSTVLTIAVTASLMAWLSKASGLETPEPSPKSPKKSRGKGS